MGSVLRVGFEPTHPKIADLKSAPLDLSGIGAFFTGLKILDCIFAFILRLQKLFCIDKYLFIL